MRLIVGLSKKLGLPGYSSIGATCQIESSEFSGSLKEEAFRRRVEKAFDACRDAVESELERHLPSRGVEERAQEPLFVEVRRVTPNQQQALRKLVARANVSAETLDDVFGGKAIEELTAAEASTAIERLRRGFHATASIGAASANGFQQGGS